MGGVLVVDELTRAWVRTGGICGVLAVVSYMAAAFLPLPDTLGYAAAFAFGPLLAVGSIGLYHCLATQRRSPLTQIAAASAVAAGVTVLLMLTVQQSIFERVGPVVDAAAAGDTQAQARQLLAGLNSVHLGLDVAWDVLISIAVVLFGIAMLRHSLFGRIIGTLGIAAGTLLLAFNLWYFPTPPVSAQSIDWGPLVALWMLVVFVMLLRAGLRLRPRP